MENNHRQTRRRRTRRNRRRVIRIDELPDDVLLDIFDFYMKTDSSDIHSDKTETEKWQSLLHVCRRWRNVVLGSSRRLNLQLYCTPATPARDTLDVWPALPLIVGGYITSSGADHIVAALRHRNRVCQVDLSFADRRLEEVLVAMQLPFPELTHMGLWSDCEAMPIIPDWFLDGSAPRLRHFELYGIPFPGLPRLLLSATHLVSLRLPNIPHSGYISPEAIADLISVLSCLETLSLFFQSPQSFPGQTRRHPPSKRSVIPALTYLYFKGVVEYLEDLVTAIDAPQLDHMQITFFNQIDFDTPRLARFINRTPKLRKTDAHVQFHDNFARVRFPAPPGFEIKVSCREPGWQLSSIEQVCNSSLPPLSTVENLYIEHDMHDYLGVFWENDAIDNTLWLQLFLPFTSVKNLYLRYRLAPSIAAVLQELDENRITEVLPSLRKIFVEGFRARAALRESFSARQLSDHPITISDWDPYH